MTILQTLKRSSNIEITQRKRCVINKSQIGSVEFAADAELISSANHFTVHDCQIEQLFALHLPVGLILQGSHNAFCRHIDDLSRGAVGEPAVHTEAQPTDTIPGLDGCK